MPKQPTLGQLQWKKGFAMVAVRADISGHFAIHSCLDGGESKVLTHVPSGFKIVGDLKDEAAARRAAEMVKGFDWGFEKHTDVPVETSRNMKKIWADLGQLQSIPKDDDPNEG